MQHCNAARCEDSISGMGLSAVCFCECEACREAMLEAERAEGGDAKLDEARSSHVPARTPSRATK